MQDYHSRDRKQSPTFSDKIAGYTSNKRTREYHSTYTPDISTLRLYACIFGSCILSPSAYYPISNDITGWDNEWHISASNHSALVSVSTCSSLPRRPSHSSHIGHNGNDCNLLSSERVSFRRRQQRRRTLESALMRRLLTALIYRRAWHLMSSVCTLPWTLMSRLRLKSLMRSCALARA